LELAVGFEESAGSLVEVVDVAAVQGEHRSGPAVLVMVVPVGGETVSCSAVGTVVTRPCCS
jgi:hypothetical protein